MIFLSHSENNCDNSKLEDIKPTIEKADSEETSKIKVKTEPSNDKAEPEEEKSPHSTDNIKTEEKSLPVDWKPQDKCYFCVDGKLLKVNELGELVVETGPVQSEAELNKNVSADLKLSDLD